MAMKRTPSSFSFFSVFDSSKKNPNDNGAKDFDPELLTKQERLSRLLHNPKLKAPLPDSGPLFEHFLLVGLPKKKLEEFEEIPADGSPSKPIFFEPQILFQYPQDPPLTINGLSWFCFPQQNSLRRIRRTHSGSNLFEIHHSQSHLHDPSSSYVFLLITEDETPMYGICIRSVEIMEEDASFILKTPEEEENDERERSKGIFSSTERCYCLLSRFPFFRLHFDLLNTILASEHLTRLSIPDPFGDSRLTQSAATYKPKLETTPKSSLSSSNIHNPTVSNNSNNNKIIRLLLKFRKLPIPEPGKSIHFYVSGLGIKKVIEFIRPIFDEEEELIADWCLPVLFHQFTRKELYFLLVCILLEKKTVIVSPNLRILSSIVLSISPLIRPFSFQSAFIPILPENLYSFLEAPVPFVVGIPELPPPHSHSPIPDDVYVFDMNSRVKIDPSKASTLPQLPGAEILTRKVKPIFHELKKLFHKDYPPYDPTNEQHTLVTSIATSINNHLNSVFASFRKHCIRDCTNSEKPITVFMKDNFLADCPPDCQIFLQQFLESQIFFHFSDKRLRHLDRSHSTSSLQAASSEI